MKNKKEKHKINQTPGKKNKFYNLLKDYNYMILLGITFILIAPFICFKMAEKAWQSHRPTDSIAVMKSDNKPIPFDTTLPIGSTQVIKPTQPTEPTQVTEPTQPRATDPAPFIKSVSDKQYFDDALFIGDSRTQGICEFSGLSNATYFADEGMNVYKVFENTVDVPGVGETTLSKLLESRRFGKVYLMLGLNEIGYNFDSIISKYKEVLDEVRRLQPDALIYIEANQHVTSDEELRDPEVSNEKLDRLNSRMAEFADNERIFYIDVNEVFDDQNGALDSKYTYDGVHIMANYYKLWSEWLCTQTMVENVGESDK